MHNKEFLEVSIRDNNPFYGLFADGRCIRKTRNNNSTVFLYAAEAVVALYYTYPAYREACVIRNTAGKGIMLAGLSKQVAILFTVRASRFDKLKRALSWLRVNHQGGAFSHDDGFWIRLACLLEQRGKLNYQALESLANIHG